MYVHNTYIHTYCTMDTCMHSIYRIVGKFGGGKSLANLVNWPCMIHQTKTIQISTYNNLLADILIRQTFYAKCSKRVNLPNFPAIWYLHDHIVMHVRMLSYMLMMIVQLSYQCTISWYTIYISIRGCYPIPASSIIKWDQAVTKSEKPTDKKLLICYHCSIDTADLYTGNTCVYNVRTWTGDEGVPI